MRYLYLLRHAKSDWSEPLADYDRPLAPRGRHAGDLIAAYLEKESIVPALVLCSGAQRTRETLAHVIQALGDDTTISIERALYGAGAADLQARLRAVDDAVPTVMVIGHNPGIEDLTHELAASGDEAALARVEAKYPTGALATLELPDARWRSLGRGQGRLTGFVAPRDLGN